LNLGINKLVAAPLSYLTKKALEPSYKGKERIWGKLIFVEYSVWTKLTFEMNETIENIIEKFTLNFGKKPTKINYKKITLYDHKHEEYKYIFYRG